MFNFSLPKWTVLDVTLPTGVPQRLLHLGDGQFLSALPPIAMAAMAPVDAVPIAGELHPVDWDSKTFDGRATVEAFTVSFDVKSAMAALDAAADRGDVAAISQLQRLKQAEVVLEQPASVQ